MKHVYSRALILATFVCSFAVAGTDEKPILMFGSMADTGGTSFLTRIDDTVLVTAEAQGLMPGDAVTLWWVVFNNPAGCSNGICGDDEFNPENGHLLVAAEVGVGNATGNVVKSNGTLEFGGTLRKNESDDHQVFFGAGFASPYLLTVDPEDAEIHIVVQIHGQGRGGEQLSEQLSAFVANCTPMCADVQFAVHPAVP